MLDCSAVQKRKKTGKGEEEGEVRSSRIKRGEALLKVGHVREGEASVRQGNCRGSIEQRDPGLCESQEMKGGREKGVLRVGGFGRVERGIP